MKRVLVLSCFAALLGASAASADDEIVACVNKTCPSGYKVVGLAGGGSADETENSDSSVACVCAQEAEMDETVAQELPNEPES